jgi:hypothetical protein
MWLVLKTIWVIITIFFIFLMLVACDKETEEKNVMYFQKNEAEKLLEQAINRDDAIGVAKAIKDGANPNTQGLHGVTPLMMAVGKLKKQAVAELLRHGASTEQRDVEGDNAVTLAVRAYKREPQLLHMVLKAGGDPNTLFSNGDPVIVRFLNDYNFDAVRYLKEAGADIDARNKSEDLLVISYGISEDWDAVWTLFELGAKYDYPYEAFTWQDIFSTPDTTPPDSPLWPYKVKVWKFLKQNGQSVPNTIEELVGQQYWDYLKKKGLPKPKLD